jgi:hypothetical protein
MTNSSKRDDLRLARMLLPAALLREIDELVLEGRGGYETRPEFILDAIQNHVLEVKYGVAEKGRGSLLPETDAPAAPERHSRRQADNASPNKREPAAGPPAAIANGEPVRPLRDLTETKLHVGQRGAVVDEGLAVVKEEPVLGLHNRDYPSIWAAVLLAADTSEELVPFSAFLDYATREAWRYAESLGDLEKQTKIKLRALFPTNFAKPQSAEEGFRAFAIGAVAKTPRDDGMVDASGPLFSWKVCQLVRHSDGELLLGLTSPGHRMLEGLDGLSLRWPHEPEYAERFLAHLQEHAPWDWAGFEQLLDAVANGPTRTELAQRFQQWQPDWSDAMANTNAAGFVARAREWGLLEPKLTEGHYALTEFGEHWRIG